MPKDPHRPLASTGDELARRGDAVLRNYIRTFDRGATPDDALVDLLTDLRHAAPRFADVDFDDAYKHALQSLAGEPPTYVERSRLGLSAVPSPDAPMSYNDEAAARGAATVRLYVHRHDGGALSTEAFADLLADLQHASERMGFDFDTALARSQECLGWESPASTDGPNVIGFRRPTGLEL